MPGNDQLIDASPSTSSLDLVIPNNRPADIVAFEAQAVDFFVKAADILGIPKSVAAIYGLFFATPHPLCFAEVGERLRISNGSISQGLKVLKEVQALKLVGVPGDRREFFVPDLELRKLIIRWLDERLNKHLEAGYRRLGIIGTSIPGEPKSVAVLRKRFEQLENWHLRTQKLLPIVKAYLKLT